MKFTIEPACQVGLYECFDVHDENGRLIAHAVIEPIARLIAAAPDLLEAAKHAMNVGEIRYKTCALSSNVHDILKAAIAKAKGEIT